MIRTALLLAVLCTGLGHAQTRIDATPLGRLLEAATQKGLFARVEGVRYYRLGGGEDLVIIQVDVKRDEHELYLQSTVNTLNSSHPSVRAINLHLGPAGQVVKLRMVLRTPKKEVTAVGRIKGDSIEFEFTEGKQVSVQTYPWSDLTVPGTVALFVLPCFYELLPKEGWSFVQFDEQGLSSGPRRIQGTRTADGAVVRLSHSETDDLQAEAQLNINGRLVGLTRGEHPRIVQITPREANRLTLEARAKLDAENTRRHARQGPPQPPKAPDEAPKPEGPKTPEAPKKPEAPPR